MRFVRAIRRPGLERRGRWAGEGTALPPQAPCQLPVTVAWAMAGGLSGMPGTDILLLDSWMKQKGVDGFSLSVSSFHIQQIRVAGCCGDDMEGLPHTCTTDGGRQRGLGPWGAVCAVGNTTTTTTTTKGEGDGGEGKREGENTLPIQAMAVLLSSKTG